MVVEWLAWRKVWIQICCVRGMHTCSALFLWTWGDVRCCQKRLFNIFLLGGNRLQTPTTKLVEPSYLWLNELFMLLIMQPSNWAEMNLQHHQTANNIVHSSFCAHHSQAPPFESTGLFRLGLHDMTLPQFVFLMLLVQLQFQGENVQLWWRWKNPVYIYIYICKAKVNWHNRRIVRYLEMFLNGNGI